MFNFFKKNKPSKEAPIENNNQEKDKSSVEMYIRYSYEYLEEVPIVEPTTCNPFCAKSEELSNKGRFWSRAFRVIEIMYF